MSVTFSEGIDMDATSVRVGISGSGGQSGVTVTEVNEPQSINGSGGGKEVEKCARRDFPDGFEYLSKEMETLPEIVKGCPSHEWTKRGSNKSTDCYISLFLQELWPRLHAEPVNQWEGVAD